MVKKFICPICGYVHEGTEAPERCPQCKQIVEWKIVDENAGIAFACEHIIGVAKDEQDPIIHDGLRAHFMGECTESVMVITLALRSLANSMHFKVLMEYLGKLIPMMQSLSPILIICSNISLTLVVRISTLFPRIMFR